ncbi:phosphoribosyltransferase family protein [Clostridium estertheticum]|uniref:phosphoribosyltransferase family protein n=1 Tax=Clostridium estertheticum TaxID=238834 RepID=UPI001C7D1260|nr:phosphoribosyltransferase family protein [Clostridium estertheticum]MBX4261829.1 phosphoribosyltransferase family protein [Clostridium estertheticum]WLC71253.1 phosphoribosyltransferase family protein [Clostridium estertheticum]
MENLSQNCCNQSIDYDIDSSLKISLTITENNCAIPVSKLFTMSARENKKRDFLFVSKVIGKHIPMIPVTLKIVGAILARLWIKERENSYAYPTTQLVNELISLDATHIIHNLDNILDTPIKLARKTLFIGFAETATGLAQSIFENFSNAAYIHTTRENITSIEPALFFNEEHSHAVEHSLFPYKKDFFNNFEDIVLIDDELTTGKSALNLIRCLPGKSFGIISILDWRDDNSFKMLNDENNVDVMVCSLIKGDLKCVKSKDIISDDLIIPPSNTKLIPSLDYVFKIAQSIEGYNKSTGRFGITSKDNFKILEEIKSVSKTLIKERTTGNCLCIGTGEFIYLPCSISAMLGNNVYFHSTTRSPVHSRNLEAYGNKNKVAFQSPEDINVTNYLYNIPDNFYDQVFFFSEKSLTYEKKEEFNKMFSYFHVKSIIFVCWKD